MPGDEIRVVAPSQSRLSKRENEYEKAVKRLESCGYKVTFGKYVSSIFHLGTAKAEDRLRDFHDAYSDKRVKAIMALNGGWSVNELLPLIDWRLLRANPKPLIGYSDITILHNAIYAKTGMVGFLGPNLGTLGYMPSWTYSLENLNAVLKYEIPYKLVKSREWGVGKDKKLRRTKPWKVLNMGQAQGMLIGGNLGTFYLLQGTEFLPEFKIPFILAIEDDDEAGKYTLREVSRRLESMLQLPDFRKNLRGVMVGRFQPDSKVKPMDLENIITSKNLGDVPVVTGMDFGHTLPMVTLPIGGEIKITAKNNEVSIELLKY